MPIDYATLKNWRFADLEHRYEVRDTILYVLGWAAAATRPPSPPPVFPGETIRTEIWRDGTAASFRARVVERDVVVLNNGLAVLTTS